MNQYKDYGYPDDEPFHSFKYLEDALLLSLNKKTNKCILDLGCGNGHLVNLLISKGYDAYGTDAAESGIIIANKTNPGKFFVQDFSTGELPKDLQGLNFDTIISTEVVEHLYDPAGLMEICKKALKNNGEVIISTPYHGYLKNLFLAIFNKWDVHLSPLWYGGHIKFWSKATLSQLLVGAGFKVLDFKGCGRIPFLWKSMIIKAAIHE
jgi:2-polyprenyl-3-methyl-5-hydroxy-6-metoxy-1,4-benzoquinol methylase